MKSHFALPLLALLSSALSALAHTTEDANTIMDAYNKAFYVHRGLSAHFANKQTGGTTYFWEQAEEIEGFLDAYDRTGNPKYMEMIICLLHGFVETNGQNWSKNIYNDDCMWACIAFTRAYLGSGDTWCLQIARKNFDMVYARAWDSELGGGLWWTTKRTFKNACINGPGAIASYLLFLSLNDPDYLTKANDMYKWERDHLFRESNGQVYDGMGADGHVAKGPTTYNQGTFIGAADYLGKTNDAGLAATFMMNNMGNKKDGLYRIMPSYGINNNNSGFNGIGIRWVAKFMVNHGLQSTYLPWLQANAEAAWRVRRDSDNLSWCQWREPTLENENLHSWDCISSVVALQAIPVEGMASDSSKPPDSPTTNAPAASPPFPSTPTNTGLDPVVNPSPPPTSHP